jgi:membrane-bound serine protease (ClpP class)
METLLYDPNIVYLILLFGLWVGVTAVYVPGTGIVELVSLIAVVSGITLLTGMPTNWAGMIILVLGVIGFLMIPFLNPRWARLAEGGLVFQALGSFMLFQNGVSVSWLLILVMIGLSIIYHRLVLLPLVNKAREHVAVVDDDKQLIGAYGRVVKSFSPVGNDFVGTVHVRGEQWTASSDHRFKSGDDVVVIERFGLQLLVEGVKNKQAPQPLEETN